MNSYGGVINWETGVDIYTLLYIKQVTNKNLLPSTGNSTEYSSDLYGKRIPKRGVCMYICMCVCIHIYI